jgi:hypothetical protein
VPGLVNDAGEGGWPLDLATGAGLSRIYLDQFSLSPFV